MELNRYTATLSALRAEPRRWLITGVAGFIGSHLLETLLDLDQRVIGLDNFSTGKPSNLQDVQCHVRPEQWARFDFRQGDVRDPGACRSACSAADYILHQAALGSVPRSLKDPVSTHDNNVSGFLNILNAAREARTQRFVYASSSSVYGDHPALPKVEENTGCPLSPYAASKRIDEIYAATFAVAYGIPVIGLRYFNVFGPRQDPEGPYAAVIPRWVRSILASKTVEIYGDGETSRDFTYVRDVVQANLLAATTTNAKALGHVYNIAAGQRTTLKQLHDLVQQAVRKGHPSLPLQEPVYCEFRTADVRHSLADISKARTLLSYAPEFMVAEGLALALDWFMQPTATHRDGFPAQGSKQLVTSNNA